MVATENVLEPSHVLDRMLEAIRTEPAIPAFHEQASQSLRLPDLAGLWVALPLWSGRVVVEEPEVEASVLAALLLARIASAVLDDIQDADTDAALWQTIGQAQAINVGVALALAGQVALNQVAAAGVAAPLLVEAQATYASTIVRMAGGQYQEQLVGSAPPSLDDYMTVVEAKTAAFCAFSCRLAGLVSGGTRETLEHLAEFGRHIGIMHQVFNDFAGLHGRAGKQDIGRRWTFPTLYVLEVAPPELRAEFEAAWDQGVFERVRAIASELGAARYLLLLIGQHYELARVALTALEGRQVAIDELQKILDRFVEWDQPPPAEEEATPPPS